MRTISSVKELRAFSKDIRRQGKTVALVPTMGNLHSGHMQLVRKACQLADVVITSIFVNPTQFGENEDLDAYPRTLEADREKLIAEGCHVLFLPTAKEMYPGPDLTRVSVNHLSGLHCGASRPGHFNGVTTIVAKFFNLVQPDYAVFGLKDFQQFTIIRQMVRELMMPVEVIGVDTGRAEDGLAQSSRNGYLTAAERRIAPALYRILCAARDRIISREQTIAETVRTAKEELQQAGMLPDYFNVCRQSDLEPATDEDSDIVILAAAYLGRARLIDNVHFTRDL